jgi:hypothetical protein
MAKQMPMVTIFEEPNDRASRVRTVAPPGWVMSQVRVGWGGRIAGTELRTALNVSLSIKFGTSRYRRQLCPESVHHAGMMMEPKKAACPL